MDKSLHSFIDFGAVFHVCLYSWAMLSSGTIHNYDTETDLHFQELQTQFFVFLTAILETET